MGSFSMTANAVRMERKRLRVANPAALSMLLLIGFARHAEPQTPPSIDREALRPYRATVNVNLVVLSATVRDQKGRPAPDLREQDFEIYEDGVQQSIRLFRHDDIPVTVGLIVDHSGSMRPKLAEVIAAARTFVQFSGPQDEMFVVNFNEKVTLGLPDTIRFSNRSDELARAIANAPVTGKTALYDAVAVAQDRLQSGSQDKKVLIVVSDGGDNASTHSLADVLKRAERSNALVYTIGIFDQGDPDRNVNVLRRLAQATGGEAFLPRQLSDVVAICERIARDIRHQYTLGYVSNVEAQPGVYRSIRIVARTTAKSKLLVRARSGYIAGGEPRPVRDEAAK